MSESSHPSMNARGGHFIPEIVPVATAGRRSVKLEGNVDTTLSVHCGSFEASVSVSLGQVKALIVIDRLEKFLVQCLSARVLGKVQQVKASVSYRQVVLPSAGGLDHQL